MESNKVLDALLGVAVGDAVGVPFEFSSRAKMQSHPAQDMVGYGTHNQPKGTWSDDSSLTFCLAESLLHGYDLKDASERFIRWKEQAYWSARGAVFDIGRTTSRAIARLKEILEEDALEELHLQKYEGDESDNGNGSLMRIMPLLFYIKGLPIEQQFELVWDSSALTHRHIRAAMSCLIYLKLAEKLLYGMSKATAYAEMRTDILTFWDKMGFPAEERAHFATFLQNDIRAVPKEQLKSGGYVIEVLESSLWFFLNEETYASTILSIINIGHDTDTSAAIVGGLAGLYYGANAIPAHWLASLARMEDIVDLGNQLHQKYSA